ncbi:hypothetical protein SUGI_0002950 [Cryptomeria japonica]|nr:hypothetical protein SUGI_0002950 [Cryptomeria japonica]
MGRGVCNAGGQSSLGYLFGGASLPTEDTPANNGNNNKLISNTHITDTDTQNRGKSNTRTSIKVQSVPGGDSSLGYLFGGQK